MSAKLTETLDEYRDSDETEVDLSLEPVQQLRPSLTPPTTRPVASANAGLHLLRRGERCGRCFRRRSVRIAFRLVNLAFACIFVASAVIQHNRSAGVVWAATYLIAAAFCVLAELSWLLLRTYVMLPALWLYTTCTLTGAVYVLITKILMSNSSASDFSEGAYNFWGLSAISFWMSAVLILDRHNVVGIFRGYSSLGIEHERDKEGQLQMGEVII